MRSQPKLNEMTKKYQTHNSLIADSMTGFSASNLHKLISLEQDIITGLDAKGQKINNTNLIKQMS